MMVNHANQKQLMKSKTATKRKGNQISNEVILLVHISAVYRPSVYRAEEILVQTCV